MDISSGHSLCLHFLAEDLPGNPQILWDFLEVKERPAVSMEPFPPLVSQLLLHTFAPPPKQRVAFTMATKIVSPPLMNLESVTRKKTLNYVLAGWNITERLFSSLVSYDCFYSVPDRLRHPLIFYFGHPATFFINKMVAVGILKEEERINPYFEEVFAVGVDEMSWDDYSRETRDWPTVPEVAEYRRKAQELIKERIMRVPFNCPVTWDQPFWAFIMGAEHERIHIETSSVLFRQLPVEQLKCPIGWPEYAPLENDKTLVNEFVEVKDTVVELGKPHGFHAYGWDNEFGRRVVNVPAFKATKFLITNREFLDFVHGGGYNESRYWSEEGWSWKTFVKAGHPLFWKREGDQWKYRALWNWIDMPWNWPVEVNYLEASAYCAWKGDGFRCITEAEWKIILGAPEEKFRGKPEQDTIMGESAGDRYNFNLSFGSSTSVDRYAPSSLGFYDVHGNVWEWTEDHADALPGFKVHPAYEDFSTPCFDGLHNLILGGSWISCGDEASDYARYWFRRHFFQHCGFRVAKTLPVSKDLYAIADNPHRIVVNHWNDTEPYEQQDAVDTCLFYSYGPEEDIVPFDIGPLGDSTKNFPKRCAEIVAKHAAENGCALDLGCGVGRSTFELARTFERVCGVEYSKAFVKVCNKLKEEGEHPYRYVTEGSVKNKVHARVDEDINRTRVSFLQEDATNLPGDIGPFDAVLMANLVDRVRDPARLLARLSSLVNPGGVVVITSPFTWLPEFTPKANWLGGFYKGKDEKVDASTSIQNLLADSFELVEKADIPMVIREHQRKYQLCVPHCSVWRRK